MRITKKRIFLVIVLFLIAYVLHILISTGFFRTIVGQFDGKVLKKISLPGAEDITISYSDKFALISSTDRKALPSEMEEFGEEYHIAEVLMAPNFKLMAVLVNNDYN